LCETVTPIHGYAWRSTGAWTWSTTLEFIVECVINDDMTPPYADTFAPYNEYVLPTTDAIIFHAKDADTSSGGVNTATVSFSANDGTKAIVPGTLDLNSTDPNDVICTFDVDDGYDFPDGTINCEVASGMEDMLGNVQASSYPWEFSVDGTSPYVNQQDPTPGSNIYPDQDTFIFHVVDDGVGVDTSSIIFSIDDQNKGNIENKASTTSSSGSLMGTSGKKNISVVLTSNKGVVPGSLDIDDTNINDVICTFDVDDGYDFTVGQTITLNVAAGLDDLLGNATTVDETWNYNVASFESVQAGSLGSIKVKFE